MEHIYHEQQEASLCAVHCLNSLLQGNYFSAVDLAELAQNLDKAEQQTMAEYGTHTSQYREYMRNHVSGSNNMDDSGMFSVQVLSSALQVWNLQLVPLTARATAALANGSLQVTAFICNMKEHWFTVRRIGGQWFNLNSLLAYPELLSDTYLSLFITQLQHQGYIIYVVEGSIPPCTADEFIHLHPVLQRQRPPLLSELRRQAGSNSSSAGDEQDADLAAAISASLADSSVNCAVVSNSSAATGSSNNDSSNDSTQPFSGSGCALGEEDESEAAELERALQLSLDEHLTNVFKPSESSVTVAGHDCLTPDSETLRQLRLKHFEKKA